MKNIENALGTLNNYVVNGIEFDSLINDIIQNSGGKIEGISYVLINFVSDNTNQLMYGTNGEGTATSIKKVPLENQLLVEISLWYKDNSINEELAEKIFKAFWNSEYSSASSGLPTREKSEFRNKCNRTIFRLQEKNKNIAVFMMDLDHFSEVNNNHDHDTGSAVIREFANILLQVNNKRGILVHQSGDEFNLLITYENPKEVVDYAKEVRFTVKQHEFEMAPDVKLTMAMGIRLLKNEKMDFDKAVKAAEELYYPKTKNAQKQRDSIRIGKNENGVSRGEDSLKLAICRIKSNIYSTDLFYNIYLDYLSDYASKIRIDENFRNNICNVINWINPNWVDGLRCTKTDKSWDTKEEFSVKEIGLALIHGLLRNEHISSKKMKIDFGKNKDNFFVVCADGEEVFQLDKKIENDQSYYEINIPNYKEAIISPLISKRVVLVQAGYDREIVPEDIFYNIIRVDNRPSIGGGLPDFWAAALCELISNMNSNENLTDIVIYGDTENTQKIKCYLENIKQWGDNAAVYQYDYIAKKTYKPIQDIRKFKKKFSEHIKHIKTKEELINHIFDIYNKNDINWNAEILNSSFSTKRFLNRHLTYDDIRLELYDGCKAQSISDAYPTVLEILRNSNKAKGDNSIVDQAGREILELTNFKITLSTPKSNDLPDYYSLDADELNDYYNATLGKEDGLFRKLMSLDDQLNEMLQHVMSAVANKEKRYATRRAILVVPNKVHDEGNYSPLGLVSIWLAPRFIVDEIVEIDFSYTWRTVEALVGLPLSMYASIKFAEDLTKMISKKVTDEGYDCIIKMGQVFYIAYSLHMFLDEESMNIVRGIVNEASV